MSDHKVRVGLVGASARYGWNRRSHLPALLALPEYELTAVCTAHQETAEESAKQYGAPLAFCDYHEMVEHPDVDLVSVSVRAPLHYPIVIAALEAGKHIFCEWPLGATLGEAQEMAALAQSKRVSNMVGLQARGDPALLHLKQLLAEGYVGEVLTCSMSMFLPGILENNSIRAWMADVTKGGHTLSIHTGHSIDVVCFCVGEFKEVSSQVTTQVSQWTNVDTGEKVDVSSPDNVLVSGVLDNGVVASVHVATIPWHGTGWRMEVYGTEGTLVASSDEMVQYSAIRLQGGRSRDARLEDLRIPDPLTWVPEDVPKGRPFNVAQLYRRLGEAILGKQGAEPDFNLAVTRHRLLDAIQRSSDQGERVIV